MNRLKAALIEAYECVCSIAVIGGIVFIIFFAASWGWHVAQQLAPARVISHDFIILLNKFN